MPEDFNREVRLEFYRASMSALRELGIMALKTILTLNSGAFVVLLTFIGNTAAQSRFAVPLWNLKMALSLFLVGIALTFIAIAYAYFFAQAASPYPEQNPKSGSLHVAAPVVLASLAVVAFLSGVIFVIAGVEVAS
jgi:hypothetical protein